jgi:amino acid transporter
MKILEKLFRKIPVNFRFAVWVILAFGSFISFIHSDNKSNVGFGLLGAFLAVLVVAIGVIAFREEKEIEDSEKL